MPSDQHTPRSAALAQLVNAAVAEWAKKRGTPVTPSELAYRVSEQLGAPYDTYQVRRVLRGEVRFAADDKRLLAAWVAAVPPLDGPALKAAARRFYAGINVDVQLATTSDRWATRGPKDRTRPQQFAEMVTDALTRWSEQDPAAKTSAGAVAYELSRHLGRPYRYKQVQRVLDGELANLDPELVDAFVAVIPTLDRAEVARWWLGDLAKRLDERELRSVLTAEGHPSGEHADQHPRDQDG